MCVCARVTWKCMVIHLGPWLNADSNSGRLGWDLGSRISDKLPPRCCAPARLWGTLAAIQQTFTSMY